MTVSEAYDTAVAYAIAHGTIDAARDGAVIEAGRKVAAMMDAPDWPMVNGKLDNVSPSAFLKYCDALRIRPEADAVEKPKAAKLTAMAGSGRFGKAADA